MALPTISNNTPSAGSIRWTAFTIVWDGVAYPVAAGSTSQPYTWWEYRAGTPAIVSGAAVPSSLGPADLLLFLNKNGMGVLAPATDVVEGSLIVPGTILAAAIGADQIQSVHIATNAITADELAAGSVLATKIAAGAVTADKLSIGAVGDSRVVNGSFEDGVQGWERISGTGIADVVTGVASAGANALRLTRGTANNLHVGTALDFAIPVTAVAGRSWYIGTRAGASASIPDGFYLRAYWYQADRVTAASTAYTEIAANVALSTSWAMFEGQATPPANARYLRVVVINARSGSVMFVDEIVARELIVAAQIGDGQISTPKLAANAVTADKIKAGEIATVHLAAGAITADKLDADAINGKTITGATIRSAASGQRVEVLQNRADIYSPNGSRVGTIYGGDDPGQSGGFMVLEGAGGNRAVMVGPNSMPPGGNADVAILGNGPGGMGSVAADAVYTGRAYDYATGSMLPTHGIRQGYRASERSFPSGQNLSGGQRFNQTLQSFSIPAGLNGTLRVTAEFVGRFTTATGYAGWLALEVNGVLGTDSPAIGARRWHNSDVTGALSLGWRWDIPLGPGAHTARVVLLTDGGVPTWNARDLQSVYSLEY